MTRLLDEAIATVRQLPEDEQDRAARLLLGFANPDSPLYQISEAQAAEVETTRREVREGKIATDADMAEVWQRFRR